MIGTSFNDAHKRLTEAAERARRAHEAHRQALARSAAAAAERATLAAAARVANEQWAGDQTREVAAIVESGMGRLPGELDPALVPAPPPALVPSPRLGLESTVQKAKSNFDGIQDGRRELLGWQARRASRMGVLGIGAVVVLVLIGAGALWVIAQGRAEQAGLAAAAARPTLTAAALTRVVLAELELPGVDRGTATAVTGESGLMATSELVTAHSSAFAAPTTATPRPTRTPRPPPTPGPTPTSLPPGSIVCPGALETRLSVGGRARVINYQLNVRFGPGTNNSVVRRLDPGRTVDILDGPVCDEGQLWYYIISEEIVPRDGSSPYRAEGWLVEESGGAYYLEPIR